ncbi:hypothetical protein KAFR_0A07140 [Kazachstania africana CBS 2517]|uniref:RNA polymerase II assembly factor Rtp1 C-terminal domain-containing protein n=1 Tax=Kazachstania africana (strain ATCC 22294 / BCRC 22015 / CBS 2517 / CECT 1963 / NBRC 1671 / NRRL Y-8276) TaxID=1071382 RepID=H2AP48_KAZAF|nr:hypothetical protein KAFR_0A07140 [Kazachstania africana CBS 2517]CCF56148.1 hypothetical protein KAFR_0A07140 [Kazachstania africana CBS 2517]
MVQSNEVKRLLKKAPSFVKDTPLDRFFERLDGEFFSKITHFQKLDNYNVTLYEYLGLEDNKQFVIKLCSYIDELHKLVLKNQDIIREKSSDLLPISLHDLQYVDGLLNLIIVHGFDANIQDTIRIPLEGKNLANFKNTDRKYVIPPNHERNTQTLSMVTCLFYDQLVQSKKINSSDYFRSILLKGSMYTNTYIGLLALFIESHSDTDRERLEKLESIQETYTLFSIYTLLTQTITLKEAKDYILEKLTTLTIRRESDGLLSLVDFILGVREDEQVDPEKINRVHQIIMSRPSSIPNQVYLSKLFNQIYDCLTYVNRPLLINVLNGMVTAFFLRNKKIVKDFLFRRIYETLFNVPLKNHSCKSLNDNINILISLSKNSSIEVICELVAGLDEQQFCLNLWIYSLFLKKEQKIDPLYANKLKKDNGTPYFEVVLSLLKTFIVLTEKYDILKYLSSNLLNYDHEEWEYRIELETQLPYIAIKEGSDIDVRFEENQANKLAQISGMFKDIDISVNLFVNLLHLLNKEDTVRTMFLFLLRRWTDSRLEKETPTVKNVTTSNNIFLIIDLKLLESLNKEFKSDIIKRPSDILGLLHELIPFVTQKDGDGQLQSDDEDSDDEDADVDATEDIVPVHFLIDLLNAVLEGCSDKDLLQEKKVLTSISGRLLNHSTEFESFKEVGQKIDKILRNEDSFHSDKVDNHAESINQDILDKALVDLSDPLAPIKASGLRELRTLVEKKSSVISLDRVVILHLEYLKHPDPYIYLNSIKGLTALCEINGKTVLSKLIEVYGDTKKNKLDTILRVGEVFISYIQIENELFQGTNANLIIDACIEKIRQKGKLDNRLRMSAMSILGVCLQVNAKGIESRITEMLDCVFGILQLETSTSSGSSSSSSSGDRDDSFIMRRSAIHLIHDLMYNSGLSLLPKEYNKEKLDNLLAYAREKESDYLVCEQIDEVLEILQDLEIREMEEMD